MPSKRPSDVRAHLTRAAQGRVEAPEPIAVDPTPEAGNQPEAAESTAPAKPKKKVQQGINFDRDLLAQARSAVAQLGLFHPEAETPSLAALVDRAVRAELDRLEAKYNEGRPFTPLPEGARMPRTR